MKLTYKISFILAIAFAIVGFPLFIITGKGLLLIVLAIFLAALACVSLFGVIGQAPDQFFFNPSIKNRDIPHYFMLEKVENKENVVDLDKKEED